ncbi:adenosine kinase 2 [Phtheirospermum japonicum]|uniref:Adenosine kinase n=1 Tax=Phtheirospermum japonicum TaxID=374723 RepID=A0A830C487_9LAMI|nr:adenosine kinase 2 [Phtheirospermum japonicum]
MVSESMMLVAERAAVNNKVLIRVMIGKFCILISGLLLFGFRYMDYVFGNEIEARAFAKAHHWETENVEEIALKISQMPKASGTYKRVTVITHGAGPVVVVEDENVKLFSVIPLSEEEVLDTNGAVDAFFGRFMSQLVLEKPTEECVNEGLYAASVVIQMPSVTYPEDVRVFKFLFSKDLICPYHRYILMLHAHVQIICFLSTTSYISNIDEISGFILFFSTNKMLQYFGIQFFLNH